MLTRLKIKGFRSFSQESYQEINLSQLTVIVGENNAGKSNILKAIKFALDPREDVITREDFSIRRSASRSKKRGYSDKKARQIEIMLYFDDVSILPKKYHNKVRRKGFELKLLVRGQRPGSFTRTYYLDNKDVLKMHFNTNREKSEVYEELLRGITIHIAPTIRDIEYLEIFKEMLPLTGRSEIRKVVDQFAKQIAKKMKPMLRVMRKQINVEDVEFRPRVDMEKILFDTRFDFVVDEGYHVSIKNVGHGYVSKSIIALAIGSKKDKLIGIEEPELHMHPNAIRDLIKDIMNEKKQVLITSHSPVITNFIKPNQIVVVKKDNRYSKVYQLDALFRDEFEDYQNLERQIFLNRQKTELLFAKGLILVEGPYDRIAFEKICEKLRINLIREGLSIIDTGSDYFIPYMVLASLLNIRWVVVADRRAAENPEDSRTGFGTYLKALRKYDYITDEQAHKLVSSIGTGYLDYETHLKAINKHLVKEGGKVIFLKGADLSDEIFDSVRKMQYKHLKLLFQRFRGSRHDTNRQRVLKICEMKIKKKDWDMITALEVIDQRYLDNFTNVIKECYDFLVPEKKTLTYGRTAMV